MKKYILSSLLALLISINFCLATYRVISPDGYLTIEFSLKSHDNLIPQGEWLTYNIKFHEKDVVMDSPIRLKFRNVLDFGKNIIVKKVNRQSINHSSELLYGKTRMLYNYCNEINLFLQDGSKASHNFILQARAYNEAAAFRISIGEQDGIEEILLEEEQTYLCLPSGSAYVLPLEGFKNNYESNYEIINLDQIPQDWLIGLPCLIHLDSEPWLAITEANLVNYPGMYLSRISNKQQTFISRLAPHIADSTLSAKISTPQDLPWRVFMIADHPGKLIESNVTLNLSAPSLIENPCWIRPGKVSWDWWSNRVVKGRNFLGGMNTETMKYYIDFASEAELEYMLIDAEWYGKHDTPNEDITTTIPEINMPEIIEYASRKNVGIWLWLNWECVRDQMDVAFPLYEQWGVKGVKIDYMNRDDQEMVQFYTEVCKKAAGYHLMVDFHGAYKPTGLRRTYPNLLTREGVLGLEWSKWSEKCNPDHELILPFTRMLAGPMDFTPGAFHVANREKFKPVFTEPMAQGTRAHQLSMFVIYESPLQMLVDHPASYFGQVGFDFLKVVPTVWDDTKFIDGEIADYIILARQSGKEWYIGCMTDWTARIVSIPLDFLQKGTFLGQIYQDGKDAEQDATQIETQIIEVTNQDTIKVRLASGGGCAIRLLPTWR